MKITVTGSLGNISKPLAEKLIRAGHQVTIISSNKDRVAEIEALGAKAAIGSVEDGAFLTGAFRGADVVYTMAPPNFKAANYRQYITGTGHHYAAAIQAAGVKRVVNLSSIGAHLPDGTGPVAGLHGVEQILNKLEGVSILHLRPAFFYTNFYRNVDMIKTAGFLGANYGEDSTIVLVHTEDIADAAAEEIQRPFTGTGVRYVVSDERTGTEIASVIGAAIGKPGLKWVEFTDEQALNGMIQAGLLEDHAKNYVELNAAARSGILFEEYYSNKPLEPVKRKFEQFATEFASAYLSAL